MECFCQEYRDKERREMLAQATSRNYRYIWNVTGAGSWNAWEDERKKQGRRA
jgi:hypothetical protein